MKFLLREATDRFLPPAAIIAAAFVLSWFQVCDSDTFWHLKQGEYMLDTGLVVRTNIFSAHWPDYPWRSPAWLFQVALATVYRGAGWPGVAAAKFAVVVSIAGVLFSVLRARGATAQRATALTVVAISLARFRLTERPHLISLLFFAVTLLLVDRARRSGVWRLWVLPPLFAVWSNVHPEIIVGLLYLLGAAVGMELDARRSGAAPAPSTRRAWIVALLCLSAVGLNPLGYDLFKEIFAVFREKSVIAIAEYVPGTPTLVPLFWVLAGIVALAVLRSPAPRDWGVLIPLAGLFLLGARYIRDVPYFVCAAVLVLPGTTAPSPARADRVIARALPALLAAACLAWALFGNRLLDYRWGWGVNDRLQPAAAADFLAKENLPANLYNGYDQGGYVIFRLYPRLKVFQDSRVSAYPAEFLAPLHAQSEGRFPPDLFERFGINTALVAIPEARPAFPAGQWAVLFWDDRFCVLTRRAAVRAELLARLEYQAFLPWPGELKTGEDRATLELLATEMRRNQHARRAPSAVLAADLGLILTKLGRFEEARESLLAAVSLAPREAAAWAYLGRAHEGLGARAAAAAAYAKAVKLAADSREMRLWIERGATR